LLSKEREIDPAASVDATTYEPLIERQAIASPGGQQLDEEQVSLRVVGQVGEGNILESIHVQLDPRRVPVFVVLPLLQADDPEEARRLRRHGPPHDSVPLKRQASGS
jgi:hypothetical protein